MLSFEQNFYTGFNNGINRSIGNCGKCHNNTKGYTSRIPH